MGGEHLINRIADLRCKEVINICNGHRLGFVSDVAINVLTGKVVALIIPGPCRYLGLFGREDDYEIPWECINRICDDIILIEISGEYKRCKREKYRFFA